MVTDVNKTYCDDYFAMQTYVKSLHCTPETNIMFAKLFGSKRKLILKQNEIDDQFVMEGDIVVGPMGFWPPSTLWT